jgi:C4-dicarboxylate-specific signal transduction histidine kinase
MNDIWLPGQTRRPNGTGLGLTIVRDAVHDLGGKASAIAHGELGGASFIVELPIIGIGHGS